MISDSARRKKDGRNRSLLARRQMLQVGGLGLMGISLPRLLEAQDTVHGFGIEPRADACIVLSLIHI